MGGRFSRFVALSCKLRLVRFSARLRFQDRAECGNIIANIRYKYQYIIKDISVSIGILTGKSVNSVKKVQSAKTTKLNSQKHESRIA